MTVAVLPLNFTVLVPWLDPNAVPAIVTDAPTAPDVGDSVAMPGAADASVDTKTSSTSVHTRRIVAVHTIDNERLESIGAWQGKSNIRPHQCVGLNGT